MSDDLIRRKELLGTERLLMTDIVENNPTAKYILEQVLFDIEHADAAFDKEKVIDKIKDYRDLIPAWALREIVEITEKGGIKREREQNIADK